MEPHQGQATGKPKEIGGFEIIAKLGQGGMGTVFKARQKSLDREVALKILPPSIAKNTDFIERFQREARASAKLNHPNIVQGIDVGKDPASGLWYFAMEFVDGASLQNVLKEKGTLPEKRALEIVRDIARALECAASHGIIHRDIKPDNILLSHRGEAKLADLGLAKQLSDDATLTQSGQSVGTPHYMSPEQARGEVGDIDIRTDIYALGGTLYHLVTGKTPFSGETSAVVMTKHLTEPPPHAHRVNPAVSEACSNLILRMMQKKREKRPESPTEVIAQIEKVLRNEADGTRTRRAERIGAERGERREPTGPAPAKGKPPIGLALAGLAGVAVIAFMLLRSGAPSAETKPGSTTAAETPTKPAAEPAKQPAPASVATAAPTTVKAPVTPVTPVASNTPNANTPVPHVTDRASAQTAAEYENKPVTADANRPAAPDPREAAARQMLGELIAEERAGTLAGAALAARLEQFVKEHGPTLAGQKAAERLKQLQAAVEREKEAEAAKAALAAAEEAKAAEARAAKMQDAFNAVLKETAPLLASNKYTEAISLLDRRIGESALTDIREQLKQERADVEGLQALRREAIEALRKMAGKTVSLKKGAAVFKGLIKEDARRDNVSLKVDNGLELTLSAEQLHVNDVDTHAPKAADADGFRRRGLLFLAVAGADKDHLAKAKEYFTQGRDAGLSGAARYLDRVEVIEMGEVEAAAQKAWLKAEAYFAEKRIKDAAEAYEAFQQKYAATKTLARNAAALADRLKEIDRYNKPEVTFRSKESMNLFPTGYKQGPFPAQEEENALAPFANKPVYFNQKTGTDVVYDIRSNRPLKHLRWKGAAMQNMTIEILDGKGNVLSSAGPFQGGNKWAEFTHDFEPIGNFTLRFRNHISTWYFINEVELK